MAKLIVTDRDGETFETDAVIDTSVMEAIRETGRGDLQALCSGTKACATCHVLIDVAWWDQLEPMDADEDDLLGSVPERQPNSRLSCQILMSDAFDGLAVTIATET